MIQTDDNLSWYVDGYINNHEFIDMPATPFVGDSPLSMWRIDSHINNGMPYVPLMIDLPVLSHNILYGINQVQKIYYGTQDVSNVYFGTKRID